MIPGLLTENCHSRHFANPAARAASFVNLARGYSLSVGIEKLAFKCTLENGLAKYFGTDHCVFQIIESGVNRGVMCFNLIYDLMLLCEGRQCDSMIKYVVLRQSGYIATRISENLVNAAAQCMLNKFGG